MYKKLFSFMLFAIILSASLTIFGQGGLPDIGIRGNLALGVVKTVGEKKLVVATKDGALDVVLLSITAYKSLPPDNLSLKAAKVAALSDISVGDRVLIVGKVAVDKKSIVSKTVYLVKNSEIEAERAKEIREWRTRGVSGRVSLVDAKTKVITVEMRGVTGAVTKLLISPKAKVKYLRYSSNSFKYKDAVESDFSEIKEGDMLRALGDRSEDRTSLKAEQILTGAFLTVAGTVKSIDSEKNEVVITDLKTKKDLTIAVNAESLVKKFPERIAQMMARSQAAGMQTTGGTATGTPQPPARSNRNRANGQGSGGRGRRGGGRGDINDMLNRFPTIKVGDLKVGEIVAVSSPKGNDPLRLTAIKLLAGVEPFIKLAQMSSRSSGRGRGGINTGFTIPGLNGVDF